MTKYDEYDWDELPTDIKAAAQVLGYTKDHWDNSKEPEACDEDWDDLEPKQQAAATKMGYTKETWDKSSSGTSGE